jgi:PncC family amidohydrolase
VLGVDEETIRWHGAVSPEVAEAMARGAKRIAAADVALALTGIAGPGGGSEIKPVGTVYMALTRPDGTTDVQHRVFSGDREQIRTLASYAGLQMVRELCASRIGERTAETSGVERS